MGRTAVGITLLPCIVADCGGSVEAGKRNTRGALGKNGLVHGKLVLDVLHRNPLAGILTTPGPDSKVTTVVSPRTGAQIDRLAL